MTELKFFGKYLINAELECKTGMHIGGTKETIEIGGLDNPVIRDLVTDEPYVPGSSLKGKLRSIAEFKNGKIEKEEPHVCPNPDCAVCRIFGTTHKDAANGVSRTIVRDAFLTNAKEIEGGDKSYTEIKTENSIDRIRGKAISPRTTERVPKGAKFGVELVYTIYQQDDLQKLKNLLELFPLLEDDTLGGSGSRGYGRVSFGKIKISYRPSNYYGGDAKAEKTNDFGTFREACEKFETILKLAG